MTINEIRKEAYLIATGNYLTQSFTEEQFSKIDIGAYRWEPLEDWEDEDLINQINSIAEDIISLCLKI